MSAKRVSKATPVRTALTAAAIIGAGILTGTLLALTPIFDEVSTFSVPHIERTYSPLQSSGVLVPPPPSPVGLHHHEPQPHLLHGARPFNPAHQNLRANL